MLTRHTSPEIVLVEVECAAETTQIRIRNFRVEPVVRRQRIHLAVRPIHLPMGAFLWLFDSVVPESPERANDIPQPSHLTASVSKRQFFWLGDGVLELLGLHLMRAVEPQQDL